MQTTILDLPAILAVEMDRNLANEWAAPPLSGFLPEGSPASDLCLVHLTEPAEANLCRLDPVRGTAAVLSALGYASMNEGDAPIRVRLTVAVTCCGCAGILREQRGVAASTQAIAGSLVEHLRRWASLTCAGHDGPGYRPR